jgi:two-component system phosphate regulon sensor histidine kinase PhoR
MLHRVRWRIAIPFVLLIAAVTGGLALYYARSGCITTAGCVLQTTLWAGAVTAVLVVVLAWLIAERTIRPVREVSDVARRITEGDRRARVLPRRSDEVGELILSFNRMVESMREEMDALNEDHQQFGTVLDHMADGVLITDNLSNVNLVNPAACRLLGIKETEALGRSFAAVVRHHQLIDLWQRCQEQGREQLEAVEVGQDLFLQAVVTPFPQKGAPGYLVILQDLTQVRRLQTMRRDFISNLSHELRSPLASLRAVVETLADGALEDRPAAIRFLERAEREVDTMTQMVDELTELSQIESGQIRLRLAPIAVCDLVTVPLERLRPQAERAGLTIKVKLGDELPPVVVDKERIQQVVTNLIHNAIKFTPSGGRIEISANEEDGADGRTILVEVRDTGIGIPKPDLPRIFERFYKLDRARTRGRGGTGLGLAIARHIVQAHGGQLWAVSKEGKGSIFYFTLPAATSSELQER